MKNKVFRFIITINIALVVLGIGILLFMRDGMDKLVLLIILGSTISLIVIIYAITLIIFFLNKHRKGAMFKAILIGSFTLGTPVLLLEIFYFETIPAIMLKSDTIISLVAFFCEFGYRRGAGLCLSKEKVDVMLKKK